MPVLEEISEKSGISFKAVKIERQDSDIYKSGKYGDLLKDGSGYKMAANEEPDITGAIKTASQVADALILQYYEEPDVKKASFGYDLSQSDWAEIGGLLTKYAEIKYGAPLVSVNMSHPLIRELYDEIKNEKRKFSFLCSHDVTVYTTLSALRVKPYTLPDSIETKTPIGVKLLFERWRDSDGKAWYRVDLVYRSTEQIRNSEVLSLDNPPMRYNLIFEGVPTNEDGLIAEADLFDLFDRTLAEYDELLSRYTEEALDEAA